MIKTKLTALTLAGLMAVASGAAFAESTTSSETPINKNATKLPGTNTQPMDRTSSETPGAQTDCEFHVIRTLSPPTSGHSFHAYPDRQSERSDAGLHC
ncbi:hypothetical protein [Pseudomonas savastanoi]|uniref:hypothetical protein n=3 Tax=Pseudomonas savastanoi TaxID=29438 RepID=UPI0009C08EF9